MEKRKFMKLLYYTILASISIICATHEENKKSKTCWMIPSVCFVICIVITALQTIVNIL